MDKEEEKFIRKMTRQEAEYLGFVPLPRLMRELKVGNVGILRENGEVVGYIYTSPPAPVRRVFQLAVREDARRVELATNLLQQHLGDTPATLRCAANIPGAEFWRAVGFDEAKRDKNVNRRKRDIITFTRGNTTPLL